MATVTLTTPLSLTPHLTVKQVLRTCNLTHSLRLFYSGKHCMEVVYLTHLFILPTTLRMELYAFIVLLLTIKIQCSSTVQGFVSWTINMS